MIIKLRLLLIGLLGFLFYPTHSWPYLEEIEEVKLLGRIKGNKLKKTGKVHKVTATVYNPVKGQCSGNPLLTADNSKICLKKLRKGSLKWIAISQDLLGKEFNFGDRVLIECSSEPSLNGVYEVHDTMNKRHKKKIDILQPIGGLSGKWKDVKLKKLTKESTT